MTTGTRDYKCTVTSNSLRHAFQYAHSPPSPVSYECLQAAKLIMMENNITRLPLNTHEALDLYSLLITVLDT